ncbi:MAG: hypothetical protein ACOCY6_01785 [Halodesulfurarchaeum sp.]
MALLRELVAGGKAWVIMVLIDWVVVLIAAVVFFGTLIAGSAWFGETAGFGIGIGFSLLAAFLVGPRLRKRLIDLQE